MYFLVLLFNEELIASPASNLVSSHQSRSGSCVSRVSRYLVNWYFYFYFHLVFVSILISRYVGMYLYLYVVFYISIGYPGMWCLLLYFHLAFVVVFIYGICIFTCYPDNYCLFMYIFGAFYFYWVSWYLMFIFHTLYLIFIFHISSPRYQDIFCFWFKFTASLRRSCTSNVCLFLTGLLTSDWTATNLKF